MGGVLIYGITLVKMAPTLTTIHLPNKLACRAKHLEDERRHESGLESQEGLLCCGSPSEGHFGGGQGTKGSCHDAVVLNEMTAQIGSCFWKTFAVSI